VASDGESDKNFRGMFSQIAGDDNVVDAYELQHILNTVYMKRTLSCITYVSIRDQSILRISIGLMGIS